MGSGASQLCSGEKNAINPFLKSPESDNGNLLNDISKHLTLEDAIVHLPSVVTLIQDGRLDWTSMDMHKVLYFLRHYSGPLPKTPQKERMAWIERLRDAEIFPTLFQMFLRALNSPPLSPKKLESDKRNISRLYVAHGCTSILRSVLLLYDPSAEQFREEGGVETCIKFLDCSLDIIKCKAILCLAHSTTEKETELLSASNHLIQYLLKLLKDCAAQSDHVGRIYPFKATELIIGLNHINTNDSNAVKSVKLGILDVYSIFIHSPIEDEELEAVVGGIWTLAFPPNNRTTILSANWILPRLQRLIYHEDEKVAQAAKGALWILSEGQPPNEEASPSTSSEEPSLVANSHIMLSYQWEYQELVIRIKDILKSYNHSVWMDIEQMSGSTLEAMAAAVEGSSVVLVCFSESYRRSPNCRTEAEYAFKLGKRIIPIRLQPSYTPMGWLGMLLGTKLFFDLSTETRFQAKISGLIKEIRIAIGETDPPKQLASYPATPHKKTVKEESAVKSWTREDVQVFLRNNEIPEEVCEKVQNLDGALLLGLKKMLRRAPNIYYSTLRQDFDIQDIFILLRLTNALEELE